MFWGKGGVTDSEIFRIKELADSGLIKNVLTFNEPDLISQSNLSVDEVISLWHKFEEIGAYKFLVTKTETSSMDDLKMLGDSVFNKIKSGLAVIFAEGEEKPMAVVVVSKDLNKSGILAGDIAKKVGGFMGGGGGGKPHLATAGGKNNDAIQDAMNSARNLINETIGGE